MALGRLPPIDDGGTLTGPPVQRVHVAGCAPWLTCAPGHREHQVNQHAAVQGEGINRALVDHFANAGVLRLEQFARGLDGDGLRVAGDVQLEIERRLLPHFENRSPA